MTRFLEIIAICFYTLLFESWNLDIFWFAYHQMHITHVECFPTHCDSEFLSYGFSLRRKLNELDIKSIFLSCLLQSFTSQHFHMYKMTGHVECV